MSNVAEPGAPAAPVALTCGDPAGIGAEIAARMADIGFDELDGPIVRVGAPFAPSPFGKTLEAAYRPTANNIVAAIRRTLD